MSDSLLDDGAQQDDVLRAIRERVLFQSRDLTDPEHGGRYTVKRLRITGLVEDGEAIAIELRSDHPDVAPMALHAGDVSLTPVAEVVRVLA